MAKICNTEETTIALINLINHAQHYVGVITPYITFDYHNRFWGDLLDALKDANERNVHLMIIVRSMNHDIDNAHSNKTIINLTEQQKKQLTAKSELFNQLHHHEFIHWQYCPHLHAKCYFNEKTMLLSSMNMTLSSVANNNYELSTLIDSKEDTLLTKQLRQYINDICLSSRPRLQMITPYGHVHPATENYEDLDGFCIYCGRRIKFDIAHPTCVTCEQKLLNNEINRNDAHICFFCGEYANNISYDKPIEYFCWKELYKQ